MNNTQVNSDIVNLVIFGTLLLVVMTTLNGAVYYVEGGLATHFVTTLLVAILFFYLYKKWVGYSITISLDKIFSGEELNLVFDKVADEPAGGGMPEVDPRQVFNVGPNEFTYGDARAVCRAYGADLATIDQVYDAYNDGGQWCNYGWTDGQLALFPTQKSTWNQLQNIPGHGHDCGRPGVNGGYFPGHIKFGVNCYGRKPQPTQYEIDQMRMEQNDALSEKQREFHDKVLHYRAELDKLDLLPWNRKFWSK